MYRITQPRQQRDAALLRQRFAAGDADMAHVVGGDFVQDAVDVAPFAAVEGVGGIAILAAQRAAGQAHEHGRPSGVAGFALQRQEDFGDFEAVRRRGDGRIGVDGVHGGIVGPSLLGCS